jgi:hypothetical protein
MLDLLGHSIYYLLLQIYFKQLMFSVVDDMNSWDFDLICTRNDIKCEHTYKIANMKLLGSLLIMMQLISLSLSLSLSQFYGTRNCV